MSFRFRIATGAPALGLAFVLGCTGYAVPLSAPADASTREAEAVNVAGRRPFQKHIAYGCDQSSCQKNVFTVPGKARVEITNVSCNVAGNQNLAFAYFRLNDTGTDGNGFLTDSYFPEYRASDGAIDYLGFNTSTRFVVKAEHKVRFEASATQIVSTVICKFTGELVKLK